jgi:GT2 family glycosyltransferase
MKVAIIIPSLNSPIIDQVLAAIEEQSQIVNVEQIIVVGKDDVGLIPHTDRIQLIDPGQPVQVSRARNLGIAATQADLLIFLDSDCLPQPDWLAEHITAHKEGHKVVGGGVVPAGHNYWHLVYNLTLFHEYLSTATALPGSRDYLPTLNLSVSCAAIEQVGGLDESVDRGEDVDWTTRMRRAGIQPYFWPKAAVYHKHNRDNMKQVWQECAHSGYYMRQLRLRHQDMLQAPALLRWPWLIWWLSPLIAAWTTGRIFIRQPATFLRFWYTLPAIYLTKIGWCWGASRPNPPR